MTNLPVLQNCIQSDAHKLFRTWRVAYELGLVLCVNGKRALWHTSHCHHLGDLKKSSKRWERSLTKRLKVLGGTAKELKAWATKRDLDSDACRHCNKCLPSAKGAKEALEFGFKLLEQADSLAAASEAKRILKPSSRSLVTLQRIIRDTKLAVTIKQLHEHRCQICGKIIVLPDGRRYAEAHHIQPLGSPHNGHDISENILCVCPNCHVPLDYRCIPIEKAKLRSCADHKVSDVYIAYHNKSLRR